MAKQSAGVLPYRVSKNLLELFLVHPGGPFYKNKDLGSWSIAKGEFDIESPFNAALREFEEETGLRVDGTFIKLTPIKQKSGKIVHAWAVESVLDPEKLVSNTFVLEFPPKSGRMQEFPEVDRAEWFPVSVAKQKIISYQIPLITELLEKLEYSEAYNEIEQPYSQEIIQPTLF